MKRKRSLEQLGAELVKVVRHEPCGCWCIDDEELRNALFDEYSKVCRGFPYGTSVGDAIKIKAARGNKHALQLKALCERLEARLQ